MIPVEGHRNLFRDEKSGAIINCDSVAYNNYLKMKERREMERKEIEDIKNEISEIKLLLKDLVNRQINFD